VRLAARQPPQEEMRLAEAADAGAVDQALRQQRGVDLAGGEGVVQRAGQRQRAAWRQVAFPAVELAHLQQIGA